MKILYWLLLALMALLFIWSGINHFIKPHFFTPFLLPFMDNFKDFYIYSSGIIEILLGVGLFLPKQRLTAAYGIITLLVIFLPLHIFDLFREHPAIGSHKAAWIRILVQLIFIGWAYLLSRPLTKKS